ncbi:hypothetical protein SADUNF_Sadunf05G0127300 [Salix dunnii]|uniref:ATPase AAA-type core domain-containing protein n=1 Tax=Salix dunnii TaxID=1413687 RepID=A0A835K847_9ROSI|nr:hypothetical protein SADUNF_Sadunf05G0127300 [Salix dunnii]
MDRSADGDGPVAVAAEGILQPERRSVRRRLVQSTLFAHKSPENCEQKLDRNCNGEDDDYQAKEYRGSQNNKRSRRGKGKTTPPTRTPKKSKEKSLKDGTPEKNGSSNGKGIGNLIENQDASPPIPNLRLEARMTAEENSRLFVGKQIHPFFSTWKVSKRCNKTTEVESNYCSAKIKDKSINIGPIHVFERDQDDARPLDWSDWELCEEPFTSSSYSLEGPFSSNFEGFIGSLDINDFPCASHHPSTSLQDNASLDQCLYQQESVYEAPSIFSSTPSDAQDCMVVGGGFFSGCTRKSDVEQQTDLLQERFGSSLAILFVLLTYPWNKEELLLNLQDLEALACLARTDSSYLSCTNQLEDDRLWTDKYQPKKATEVCGNDESVKLLSEWLCSWQQSRQPSTDTFIGDVCDRQDADYTCSQSNSDLENNNEGASLKNVLLITGPTGCGKSSAIYACAREEGFKVLEVNASECRNGAVVKQRFGEALESHSIEWSQEIHVETQSNKIAKFSLALPDGKLTPDFESKMTEVIPISNKDISLGATAATTTCASKESTIACDREQLKHLILFEDVDITFTEDRGFVSAIQQIAEKAKGPVILTSNSENPVLPASLDRLEVSFMMPSKKELLRHAYMVCSAEKVNIQPHLLEQVVEYCQGDIRKTIMHLQFWFQGKRIRKLPPGREAPRLFGPLMFDPDAGHRVLPKMMPWNLPSHLSELVEKDITNSLSMMEEENSVSMEVIEEDFKDKEMQNNSKIHNYGKDSIEAKKEAMLNQNCSDHDCDHFEIPFDAVCDVFDSSGTQVSFSQRKNRRKLNVVMSSDSEDELVNDRVPLTGDRDTNNELTIEADGAFPSHCPSTQNCLSPSTGMQLCFEVEKLDENCSQRPDITIDLHVKETSIPVDVSCVPESTFVPETQINGGTEVSFSRVYCSQVADTLEEVSVSNEFKPNLWPVETDNLDKFVPLLQHDSDMLGSICDVIAGSSHEEVEDSQNEHAEAITREYQVMDECSRMDFIKKSKPVEKFRSSMTDLVRESWRKLRDRRTDLRHFVTSEVKDAAGIIEFAYGMSNLISEAELLLSKHQTLDSSDVLDVFSWCDEHLQMSTTIARQGFCFYAKELANAGLQMGLGSTVDFTWEMLSTARMMEFGDLVGQNLSSKSSHSGMSTAMSLPESETSSNRELKSCLCDIIESIVPSRAYMTMKGDAFHEYQSSLGHIARSEASRLSASTGKIKGRRARASRNYLSNGSLMLSPEDISLLGQSNIYAKIPSPSMDATDRTM